MDALKEWLIETSNNCIDTYNDSTYNWSKGYRKACLDFLKFINEIKNKENSCEN